MKVLLLSMPFAARTSPSTALSQLKAELTRREVTCHVVYLNFAFADLVGGAAYDLLAEWMPPKILGGEWVFSACLFGLAAGPPDDYLNGIALGLGDRRDALIQARSVAEGFLAAQLADIDWSEYDVVGFTSSCEQNVASLALARLVKQRHPDVIVMFGGANWEADMGVAQLAQFPFVDVAFIGEAEEALPAVLETLERGGGVLAERLAHVQGIAYRDWAGVRSTGAAPVLDMDGLAIPDFSDYFEALAMSRESLRSDPHLWVQGSRGCWWAQRHPCRFCGLNGSRRAYRTKTPARLLGELRAVASSWPGRRIDLSDTIVSPGFLNEVVPALATDPIGVPLWLEVRPELSRKQLRAIAAAGGEIQIGVESLSDRVLRLMEKGSRVLECLRLLKWCRAEDLRCCWNLLIDIPGEADEDYGEMIRLLPALHSLTPPTVCMDMQLERFSPFHRHASLYGLDDVRATGAYAAIYPWPEKVLGEVAYTFDYQQDHSLLRRALIRRLHEEVKAWQDEEGRVELSLRRVGQGASVVETRLGAEDREVQLDDLDTLLYAACEDIGVIDDLVRLATLRPEGRDRLPAEAEELVASRLQRFVDERIMVEVGGRYLSLAKTA